MDVSKHNEIIPKKITKILCKNNKKKERINYVFNKEKEIKENKQKQLKEKSIIKNKKKKEESIKRNANVIPQQTPRITKKNLELLSKKINNMITHSLIWIRKDFLSKEKILLILKLAAISKKLLIISFSKINSLSE